MGGVPSAIFGRGSLPILRGPAAILGRGSFATLQKTFGGGGSLRHFGGKPSTPQGPFWGRPSAPSPPFWGGVSRCPGAILGGFPPHILGRPLPISEGKPSLPFLGGVPHHHHPLFGGAPSLPLPHFGEGPSAPFGGGSFSAPFWGGGSLSAPLTPQPFRDGGGGLHQILREGSLSAPPPPQSPMGGLRQSWPLPHGPGGCSGGCMGGW